MQQYSIFRFVALLLGVSPLFVGQALYSQGTFQNLSFESANLAGHTAGDINVPISMALPGWSASIGGIPQFTVLYDNAGLDSSTISIMDGGFYNPIAGSFSALLAAGYYLGTFQPADTTLSQTGLIPPLTQSLLFRAQLNGISPTFAVTLDGQSLPVVSLQSGPNSTLYACDIHSWAGQTAQLGFTLFGQQPHVGNNFLLLDAIQFSTQPVPEPGWAAFAVIALLILTRNSYLRSKPLSAREGRQQE